MTKAEKHKRDGTYEEFKARQARSHEGAVRLQAEYEAKLLEPTLEERVATLEREVAELQAKLLP